MAQYNKVINHVWEIANKAREEWESETGSRTSQAQISSTADTHLLVYAVGSGKGLKVKEYYIIYLAVRISQFLHLEYFSNLIFLYNRNSKFSMRHNNENRKNYIARTTVVL